MSGMNETLGEIFGTKAASVPSATTQEDVEKTAQIEFFTKLCQDKQLDVSLLSDTQVNELFKTAMEMKTAADAEESPEAKAKKAKEDKAKEAAAKTASAAEAEYAEKRAAAKLAAEADTMGRLMAHAYVDELKKIAGQMPPQFAANAKGKEDGKSEGKPEGKEDDKGDDDKKKKEAAAKAAEIISSFESTKHASLGTTPGGTPALNEMAGNHAIEMLKSAGVNAEEAIARINAVHTLGVPDSTKIASAANADAALYVRALEYCEAAGYPVDWTQV